MSTRTSFTYAALALLILGGGTLWLFRNESAAPKPAAVPVHAVKLERRDVPRLLTAIGTVRSPHDVTITAQVDGELKALHFREGDDIKRGQLLAEIDDRQIRASLDQARAEKRRNEALLASAKLTLQRYKNLLKDDAVTPQAVDQQVAEVAQLQAAIAAADASMATASVQLDHTRIVAPLDGRAGLRRIDPGNIVRNGDALLNVTQLQPIDVLFSLPQDHLPQLQQLSATNNAATGAPVEIRLRDQAELLARGELHTIDNRIDAATGTVQLKARVANNEKNLWPGQLVVVQLQIDTLRNALVIPARALQRGRDGVYVYRINDNRAELVDIKVLFEDERIAAIDGAVAPGDVIVIDGQSRLKPGIAATVISQTSGR